MRYTIKHILPIISIIILANIISLFIYIRHDFTQSKRYSLSKVSRDIVKNNNKPISVDFYTSDELPQDEQKLAKEFHALLKEYKSLSSSPFDINIIHPNTQEKEFAATKAGLEPIYKEIRVKNFEKIQRIFIGAVFHIDNKKIVIPKINFDTPIEYEITRMFKQATDTIKPVIGFIRGHREMGFAKMKQLVNKVILKANIQKVDLNSPKPLTSNNVLCIIDPKDSYTDAELRKLEDYLQQGGRLFIALNHAVGQLGKHNNGYINRTGIEDALEEYGLKIRYNFVVDNSCGTIAIHQQFGNLNFQSNINLPYIPIITNFQKHSITFGINSILVPFASSIEHVKSKRHYHFLPLARTSALSGVQEAPIFFDFNKQWVQEDFQEPNNIIAALLSNERLNSSIITITNAEFISDEIAMSGPVDNVEFAFNAIEWLSDTSGLIELKNKFTTFSYLDPLKESQKEFLKYLNFILPLFIIALTIVIHVQRKRKIRSELSKPRFFK